MTFNISEKQASLCRVGPVILRLWLYVLVALGFRGIKCFSFLVSLTFRCSVRYHLVIRIELLYNKGGVGFSLCVLQLVCMLSNRFGQGCTYPERPLPWWQNFVLWQLIFFSTITAFHFPYKMCVENGLVQSVERLDRGWTVRGSNSGEDEVFCTYPHTPCGPDSFLYNGYRISFPGVNRGVDHPPQSSPNVKESVELYLCSPSGSAWPVWGWTLLLNFQKYVSVHMDRVESARLQFHRYFQNYACSVEDLLCVTIVTPRIWRWLLDPWKNFGPLEGMGLAGGGGGGPTEPPAYYVVHRKAGTPGT